MLRIVTELGPWIWLVSGFGLMAAEIFSGRGIALSLALAAMVSGTVAIMGESGTIPAIALESQFGLFMLIALGLIAFLRKPVKKHQL